MKRILLTMVALIVVTQVVSAQSKPVPQRQRPVTAAEPVKAPEPVNIQSTFALSTASESWALDDAIPVGGVKFGDRQLSIEERMVNVSTSSDGQQQYLFPVSWFEPYQPTNPDVKYVVVKYKNGRAHTIMVEYLPNRLALPKSEFQLHPDGRTYYSDVAIVRQNGFVYLKQAISNGKDDGRGGLWVDMVVMYSSAEKSPEKPATTKATARRP